MCIFLFFLIGELCNRHYCHSYWGCTAAGASETKLCALKDKDLTSLGVLQCTPTFNPHEVKILQAYLNEQHKTVLDMWKAMLHSLDTGEYTYGMSDPLLVSTLSIWSLMFNMNFLWDHH